MSADGTFLTESTTSATRAAWAGRLRAMTGRIDSFFLPLEPVFLATGERLRELYGEVSRLSDSAEAAGALLSSAEMTGMLSGLAETIVHIDVMRRQRGGLAAPLGQMISGTDAMLGSLTALGRIMSQVQVLAINAKIEASQLFHTGVDFSVFTREIARLARSGEQTIDAVRQELAGLRSAATKAHILQQAFETRELPELDAVAERLAVSIQAMRDLQGRAARGTQDIPERLRALFGHITSLVSHLQVYDTTRQRLEHVERALTLAADMIEGENASGMDPQQQRVFVNGISDLQSLQLIHASEHYHEAVTSVGRSLAAMAQGVPAVGALCEQSFGAGDAGSLLDIEHNLEKAGGVFAKFTATREQATHSLDHVVQAAARARELMRSLNSVNGDMRLMGLNAAIKCGNMGSLGRALSVIAQELQAYANLTRSHVEAVAGNLGQISAAAHNIVTANGGETGQIDAEALKRDIDLVVMHLQQTGKGLSQLLETIGTLGTSVVSLTRVADESFSGKADCRPAMADGVRELKTLAADCDPGLTGAALEEARRQVLAFTESQYTMASERSIHGAAVDASRVIGLLTGADDDAHDAACAAGSGQEPDISDLLF